MSVLLQVHENPNNEYKCPDCGRIFYSKLGFNKHTAKKSCTLPFICKVCGKKYSNKAKESYKSHMRLLACLPSSAVFFALSYSSFVLIVLFKKNFWHFQGHLLSARSYLSQSAAARLAAAVVVSFLDY